jgi:hypothetical protein
MRLDAGFHRHDGPSTSNGRSGETTETISDLLAPLLQQRQRQSIKFPLGDAVVFTEQV